MREGLGKHLALAAFFGVFHARSIPRCCLAVGVRQSAQKGARNIQPAVRALLGNSKFL